jgi:hypothetical protein
MVVLDQVLAAEVAVLVQLVQTVVLVAELVVLVLLTLFLELQDTTLVAVVEQALQETDISQVLAALEVEDKEEVLI